ncbi:MAG: response regulator [Bacteroidetes bacterium]|nr:response regulator [Bacteroidota bacterium]
MKKRILILDDDLIELGTARQVLSREGFEIITATRLETAQRLLNKMECDFLLLNVRHRDARVLLQKHTENSVEQVRK